MVGHSPPPEGSTDGALLYRLGGLGGEEGGDWILKRTERGGRTPNSMWNWKKRALIRNQCPGKTRGNLRPHPGTGRRH